jgi:hypothetical protein
MSQNSRIEFSSLNVRESAPRQINNGSRLDERELKVVETELACNAACWLSEMVKGSCAHCWRASGVLYGTIML